MTRLAVSVLALSTAACTFDVEGRHHEDPDSVVDLSTALLVRTRDHLQVCLQVDPLLADQTTTLAQQLRDGLAVLRASHPDWQAAGLDRGAPTVEMSCPGGAIIDGPIDAKGTGGAVLGPGLVTAPSAFRTHVHVIADSRAAAVLGDEPYARALAELAAIDEHRIAEVSTALIVRASALETVTFRMQALAESIGLTPR